MKDNRSIKSLKNHFYEWINWADDQDKSLDSKLRKGKWMLILLGFASLFAASFIWFPRMGFYQKDLASPAVFPLDTSKDESIQASFEIPVDSFELYLKKNIHENRSEKE